MAEGCNISKIVTTFLLNTCRLPRRISILDVQAAVQCVMLAGEHPPDDEEADAIPLITGSVADFYIEPMLPLAGDLDVMYHISTMLAIPRGHPPPTRLAAEFHNYVKIVEIVDSHLPGYVYLRARYLLTQHTDNDKYEYFEYDPDDRPYLSNITYVANVHGPAMIQGYRELLLLSVDYVRCVRCLSWPPQAADWPTRHRNYGWPDSATLDRVVSNGCDVVRVAHRQCRQHEWMGKRQHRLSFSRAEILLINSWMPVQQIVYHMLRFYVKTERLTESADDSGASMIGLLSSYHIKTLMLWARELKPRCCGAESLNLVRMCVELLNNLSVWLTATRCPHYFISNCNLLDNSFNVRSVASKLMPINEEHLSTWFVYNYIGQCAQLCPDNVSRLFIDVSRLTNGNLQNEVSEIVRWRLNTSLYDLWRGVELAECMLPSVLKLSLSVQSCAYLMSELTKIDKSISVYFSAVALLHVACKISSNGFNGELMDSLSKVLGKNFSRCCSVLSRCKTEMNAPELVELLQKSAVEHLTTYRQLMARDFASIVTIVTTDFEALYSYKRGVYQQCLQLSTQNVHTLLYAADMPSVPILPEFIQLLYDDIVPLTALMLIVNPKCREKLSSCCIY